MGVYTAGTVTLAGADDEFAERLCRDYFVCLTPPIVEGADGEDVYPPGTREFWGDKSYLDNSIFGLWGVKRYDWDAIIEHVRVSSRGISEFVILTLIEDTSDTYRVEVFCNGIAVSGVDNRWPPRSMRR